jgi:hypothetical protein
MEVCWGYFHVTFLQIRSGRNPVLEPYGNSDQERSKVKLDHELLSSMMKSWLVPKNTGTLIFPENQKPGNLHAGNPQFQQVHKLIH